MIDNPASDAPDPGSVSAMENTRSVVWEWNFETGFCTCSGPDLDALRLHPQLLAQAFLERVHPADRLVLELALQRTRQRQLPCFAQFRWCPTQTESQWMEVNGAPLPDSTGQCVAIVGALQDISQRIQTGQRLQQVELRLAEETRLLHRIHDLLLIDTDSAHAEKVRMQLLQQALDTTDAQMAVLHHCGPGAPTMQVEAVLAPVFSHLTRTTLIRALAPLCERLVASRERQLLARDALPAHAQTMHAVLGDCLIGGLQCTPLFGPGAQLQGMLTTLWCGSRMPGTEQLLVLDLIAQKLAGLRATEPIRTAPRSLPPPNRSTLLAGLTPQQQRIAELMIEGRANRAIAQHLGIAENTVKAHVATVLRRLGLHSRVQLAVMNQPPHKPAGPAEEADDDLDLRGG